MPKHELTSKSELLIYSDGACSGNPGPGGWAALIYAPTTGRVVELGGGEANTTNNRMEMKAACEALRFCITEGFSGEPIRIFCDSKLVIKGATEWMQGWIRRGWLKSDGAKVLNQDLWEDLDKLLRSKNGQVQWSHIEGHAGIPGNERVDEIAVAFSKKRRQLLYDGPLEKYPAKEIFLDAKNLASAKRPAKSTGSSSQHSPKGTTYYLSAVDGEVQRHAQWAECEARVKGKSKALYKKVKSQSEENEVLRKWGLLGS